MNQDQLEIYQISKRESVVKAMQKIDENGKGILFVVDEEGKIAGSLTDGDIRRWLIRTGNLEAEISEVMHKTPVVIFQTEYEKKNVGIRYPTRGDKDVSFGQRVSEVSRLV